MVEYSGAALDKIGKLLSNPSIKTVDVSVENAVLEILLDGREAPKTWKQTHFSPANNWKDTFDVLAFLHADTIDWNIAFHTDTMMFEAYVVDKKFSVAGFSLSRCLLHSMYAYKLHVKTDGKL